jgi:hypothetical protein
MKKDLICFLVTESYHRGIAAQEVMILCPRYMSKIKKISQFTSGQLVVVNKRPDYTILGQVITTD